MQTDNINQNINLYGSICLSDIPKELITTGRNGKKYLNVEVRQRREPSAYGNTHYIKASCRVQDRREGVNYFIGDLKPSRFQDGVQDAQPAQTFTPLPPLSQRPQQPEPEDVELPF